MDLHIVTKVENQGEITNDINVLLQIENGVLAIVCGWVIWDAPPEAWARLPIIVQNVDQLIGSGDFYVSARVYDTVTPATKTQDIIDEGYKVGELYTGFTELGNQIDYAEAPFTIGEVEAELKIINIGIMGA